MYFDSLGNIVFRNKIYKSDEIRYWVNVIRKNLREKVKENSVVGITGERSEKLIYIILACIENNITFIPIDKDIPNARVEYMIDNSGADYLLGETKQLQDIFSKKIVCLDYDDLLDVGGLSENVALAVSPNNPVYIMYTSGTTGKPKGVAITHDGLDNFLNAIPKVIQFNEGEKIACFTSISFDIVFLEIVLGLSRGMNLILADDRERMNPKSLIRLIENYGIDVLQMTPSMLNMIRVYNNNSLDFLRDIKCVLLGGEKLTDSLLVDIQSASSCQIYNMYGPTETTIWSTIGNLTDKSKSDIGKPIYRTNLYLVDDNDCLVNEGEPGELLIGGAGVALGYINNSQLTEEKFIYPDFAPGERVYRTGDICRFDSEGNLIFIERKDTQVKINGHRIELKEIEYWVKKHLLVKDAVVCEKDGVLVCFYLSSNKMDVEKLKQELNFFLPSYMIPTYFFNVQRFEYTISHKIDKNKLLSLYFQDQKINEFTNSNISNDVENTVKRIVAEKMRLEAKEISSDSNIKDLGIDSISFVELIVQVEEIYDIEFDEDYLNVEEFSTIKNIAEYITELSCISA